MRRLAHALSGAGALTALVLLAGCVSVRAPSTAAAPVPERSPGVVQGYLDAPAFDSVALLPAPPAPGSATQADDDVIATRALALHGTSRWRQSAVDADLSFPAGDRLYACALGVRIDPVQTPRLVHLLRRSLADAADAGRAAKQHWQRGRPLLRNDAPVCSNDRAALTDSPAYPSGHASVGWTWALTLVALAPERADTLLQRGRSFGESRVVCNAHWHSDIVQGERVGAATFARLQAEPAFRADLEAARGEIAAQRARGATPEGCDAEAAALRVSPIPSADTRD